MYASAAATASYSRQGVHRTATTVDTRNASWLVEMARGRGAEPALDPFRFERLDVRTACQVVDGELTDGVRWYDCAGTGPEEPPGGSLRDRTKAPSS